MCLDWSLISGSDVFKSITVEMEGKKPVKDIAKKRGQTM
jgi:hypothetical protein